jgi:hypothetical protein
MRGIITKFGNELANNARNILDFMLALLTLLSAAIVTTYTLLSPIALSLISGDWQWLLMYGVCALFIYLCYKILG